MKREFSYLRKDGQSYPMIDLELVGPKRTLLIKALVDSGASYSIFRGEIADYLGVPIQRGQRLCFQGIKSQLLGYLHQLPVRVTQVRFDCNIAFSSEYKSSLNLLGRNNFFLPFLITFNEKLQKILLQTNIKGKVR